MKNKHLINIYTNYVDLLYYKQEKSNTVGTLLDGEVNFLSRSSNRIRDGKSKEKKESSTVSNSKRPRDDIHSSFSAVSKTAKATQKASRAIKIDDSGYEQ